MLGQGDITGVVGAEVRVQSEDPWEQRLMAAPGQRQQQIVVERQLGPFDRNEAANDRPSKSGHHFDVAQRGHPEVGVGLA